MEIEKGLPIPGRTPGGRREVFPLDKMEIGDSFLLSADAAKRLGYYIHKLRKTGKKFILRAIDEKTKRCWRVE